MALYSPELGLGQKILGSVDGVLGLKRLVVFVEVEEGNGQAFERES